MPVDERKRARTTKKSISSDLIPTVEPVNRSRGNTSTQYDGLSFSRTIDDDVKGSLEAVGQVCRIVMGGLLFFGLGSLTAVLGAVLL